MRERVRRATRDEAPLPEHMPAVGEHLPVRIGWSGRSERLEVLFDVTRVVRRRPGKAPKIRAAHGVNRVCLLFQRRLFWFAEENLFNDAEDARHGR